MTRIYTGKGDDGTTRLFRGGKVRKDDAGPEAYGTVDEAVSALGLARSRAGGGTAEVILGIQRELFVVAAELATAADERDSLEPGLSLVTEDMVLALEAAIDDLTVRHGLPTEFVVPGETELAAALDLARSVVRRAERRTVTLVADWGGRGSFVVPYLNRLADYLYVLARVAEGEWTPSRIEESD